MKFVMIDDYFDMGKLVSRDLLNFKNINITYREKLFKSCIMNFLFRAHFSYRVNNLLNLPWKHVWYEKLTQNSFDHNDDICFVFLSGWYSEDLSVWISKKYPNSKQVLVFRDTIKLMKTVIPSLERDNLNDIFDLVLTYNPEDAEIYGFNYTPMYISKIDKDELPIFPKTDVAFIGVAKDRLDFLHSLYEKLNNFNLKCDFYITSVNKAKQKYPDKIIYSEKYMKYLDYLGRESAANCLIEIIKGDSKGNTYRSWEAVYYNKKLVTNWKGIFEFPFYDPKYMLYIESEKDLVIDFFYNNNDVEYNYNNENSPINLIVLIEELLLK